MTRILLTLTAVAIVMATGLSLATDSHAKTKAVAGGAQLPMSTMAPLTESECERLGGSVIPAGTGQCKGTGKACFVDTLNNGSHITCINEVR